MGDFAKLHVWRKAHALALNVHTVAIRIRGSNYVSLRSLGYALNSSSELEYHLVVARDIRAITLGDFTSLLAQLIEVRKMLHGLLKRVNAAKPVPSAAE